MTCHCGSIAIWYVGANGFCRAHKAEAYRAAAHDKKLQQSVAGLIALDLERRKSDEGLLSSRRHRA